MTLSYRSLVTIDDLSNGEIEAVFSLADEMAEAVNNQTEVCRGYDFVNILEAPSNEAVSKVAIALGSRGTLQTMTMAALDIDDFIGSLRK